MKTVVIAGASGYIGHYLVKRWEAAGIDVRTIARGPTADATWSDEDSIKAALQGSDVLVNLAGRSVDCRYNKKNADAIFSSRIETTATLGRVLSELGDGPSVWLNASTGTIYRDARDRPMDERSGELGSGFSVAVARGWERELFEAPVNVRKVALRLAIVLGPGGGAINPLINLGRLGLGGRMGDGEQLFSWVHMADVAAAIEHIVADSNLHGPINVAAPGAVTNAAFMTELRRALGRSWGVPSPAWLLELGARVIRTETELILKSRWVEPRRLVDSGFTFRYPELRGALHDIVADSPRGLVSIGHGTS